MKLLSLFALTLTLSISSGLDCVAQCSADCVKFNGLCILTPLIPAPLCWLAVQGICNSRCVKQCECQNQCQCDCDTFNADCSGVVTPPLSLVCIAKSAFCKNIFCTVQCAIGLPGNFLPENPSPNTGLITPNSQPTIISQTLPGLVLPNVQPSITLNNAGHKTISIQTLILCLFALFLLLQTMDTRL